MDKRYAELLSKLVLLIPHLFDFLWNGLRYWDKPHQKAHGEREGAYANTNQPILPWQSRSVEELSCSLYGKDLESDNDNQNNKEWLGSGEPLEYIVLTVELTCIENVENLEPNIGVEHNRGVHGSLLAVVTVVLTALALTNLVAVGVEAGCLVVVLVKFKVTLIALHCFEHIVAKEQHQQNDCGLKRAVNANKSPHAARNHLGLLEGRKAFEARF